MSLTELVDGPVKNAVGVLRAYIEQDPAVDDGRYFDLMARLGSLPRAPSSRTMKEFDALVENAPLSERKDDALSLSWDLVETVVQYGIWSRDRAERDSVSNELSRLQAWEEQATLECEGIRAALRSQLGSRGRDMVKFFLGLDGERSTFRSIYSKARELDDLQHKVAALQGTHTFDLEAAKTDVDLVWSLYEHEFEICSAVEKVDRAKCNGRPVLKDKTLAGLKEIVPLYDSIAPVMKRLHELVSGAEYPSPTVSSLGAYVERVREIPRAKARCRELSSLLSSCDVACGRSEAGFRHYARRIDARVERVRYQSILEYAPSGLGWRVGVFDPVHERVGDLEVCVGPKDSRGRMLVGLDFFSYVDEPVLVRLPRGAVLAQASCEKGCGVPDKSRVYFGKGFDEDRDYVVNLRVPQRTQRP